MATKHADSKFAPPFTPGLLGALCMAVVVHVLLLLALSMEMRWDRDTNPILMEVELWTTVPVNVDEQQAALAPQWIDVPIPQDTVVLPPSQQVSPQIVVGQDQKEKKRREKEASLLRALEEEHRARDEMARDPT